jgi:hypothetical protein
VHRPDATSDNLEETVYNLWLGKLNCQPPHLVDGTCDLFRHYYALPSARDQDGREVAAVRGVLGSVLGMIRGSVAMTKLSNLDLAIPDAVARRCDDV